MNAEQGVELQPGGEDPILRLLMGRGEIGRKRYLLWGLGLAALKWNLDRLIGYLVFDQGLTLNFRQLAGFYLWQLAPSGMGWQMGAAFLALSLPFFYAGVVLTLGRLRSAALSPFWVLLFLVPVLKLLFFAILVATPRRGSIRAMEEPAWLRWVPSSRLGAAAVAVGVAAVLSAGATVFAVQVMRNYGWALFVGTPFLIGFFATLIYSARDPRRLAFRVESNPAPMEEWTPYPHIHPPHLEGHFLSRKGEFLLEPMPDGGTRLIGTTWYEHKLWPDAYWRVWSDSIIHTIHLRVLRHVKSLSEAEQLQVPRGQLR
jgi:uncharacterized membrane protein YhaH (DUF805 family)